jgi:hypothetical protein
MSVGRKGQELFQVFPILLFVFLIIVAIALLTIESDRLEQHRPQLDEDLAAQYANSLLVSMLRTSPDKASIADLAMMNSDGRHDVALTDAVGLMIPPDHYFELLIIHPDGRTQSIRNTDALPQTTSSSPIIGNAAQARTLLPGRDGNIEIILLLASFPKQDAQVTSAIIDRKQAMERLVEQVYE